MIPFSPVLRKPIKCILLIAAVAVCSALRTNAADTKSSPVKSPQLTDSTVPPFETFRPIAEQNIFNPSRIGRSARTGRTAIVRPPEDVIRLVGTMEYEKGYFAFFDSPNAKFRTVLAHGGVVSDFTVKGVTASGVELTHGAQSLSLKIAQQLTRTEGSDWVVSATPPPADASATSSPEASSSESATALVIPPDASDTLKRLMEQRQKQLKE